MEDTTMVKYYFLAIYNMAKAFAKQAVKSLVLYVPILAFILFKGYSISIGYHLYFYFCCISFYSFIEAVIMAFNMYVNNLKKDAEKAAKLS